MVNKGEVNEEVNAFKWKIALMFHKSLPGLSRFYLSKFATGGSTTSNLKITKDVKCDVCRFCGSLLTLGNNHSRLITKKNSKKCKKSRKELAKIRKKARSNNKTITMITRCLTCKRITKRLKANKSNQNETKAKNVIKVESQKQAVKTSNVQLSIQQSVSSKLGTRRSKSKKKKKPNVKQQIQQLLQSQNQNSSGKSRLESFLSSL